MILLLGGTSDSLEIAKKLTEAGRPFYLSVVSDYGERLAATRAQRILKGRLTTAEMIECIETNQITQLIDATHPYAVEVSKNAMAACTQTGKNYIRFERPSLITGEMLTASSVQAACERALDYSGTIYLTTGSKTLKAFLNYLPKERVIVRALPTAEVVSSIEALGLSTHQIEAIKGPFSKALNRELLIHNQAGVMVTKESGQAGGFLEKYDACNELGIPCIVLTREHITYSTKFSSIKELIDQVKGD